MSLPVVSWTIDGREVPMQDWRATSVVDGGYKQFSGRTMLRSSYVAQGDQILGYQATGDVVWAGTIDAEPAPQPDGTYAVEAQGYARRLADRQTSLIYHQRGFDSNWYVARTLSAKADNLSIDVDAATINFSEGNFIATNSKRGFKYFPIADDRLDHDIKVRRVRFRFENDDLTGTDNDLILQSADRGGAFSTVHTFADGLPGGAVIYDHTLATPRDVIAILYERQNSPVSFANDRYMELTQMEVYCEATTNTTTITDVVKDVATRVGLDSSGVGSHTRVVFPLAWQEGGWDELFNYLVSLDDLWWRVLEPGAAGSPKLETGSWDTAKRWHGVGVSPSLTPESISDKVVALYQLEDSAAVAEVAKASPDPIPDETYTHYVDIPDQQESTTFPQAIADTTLAAMGRRRSKGTATFLDAFDENGVSAGYLIKPGEVFTLPDERTGSSIERRIHEVEMTESSVTLGLEDGFSLERAFELERLRRREAEVRSARRRNRGGRGR